MAQVERCSIPPKVRQMLEEARWCVRKLSAVFLRIDAEFRGQNLTLGTLERPLQCPTECTKFSANITIKITHSSRFY